MTNPPLDKLSLLAGLEKLEPEPAAGRQEEQTRSMSLARSLRFVAKLEAEQAHQACRDLAEHLLGSVPEPQMPLGE